MWMRNAICNTVNVPLSKAPDLVISSSGAAQWLGTEKTSLMLDIIQGWACLLKPYPIEAQLICSGVDFLSSLIYIYSTAPFTHQCYQVRNNTKQKERALQTVAQTNSSQSSESFISVYRIALPRVSCRILTLLKTCQTYSYNTTPGMAPSNKCPCTMNNCESVGGLWLLDRIKILTAGRIRTPQKWYSDTSIRRRPLEKNYTRVLINNNQQCG